MTRENPYVNLLPVTVFVEGGVHVMRFPENETSGNRTLEPVKVLRVETGHVLIARLGDRRVWMGKDDAARRCYDALEIMKNMGWTPQSIPKKVGP